MDDIIFGVALLTVIAVVILGLPFYLGWFIYRRLTAEKNQKTKPSAKFLVIYLIVLGLLVAAGMEYFFLSRIDTDGSQSEAKTNLIALYTNQRYYFSEHPTYAGGPNAFTLLYSWKPAGETRYAYFCGDDFIPNTKGDPIPRSLRPSETGSSSTGFTCFAVGNMDDDPDLDYWYINDAKVLENLPLSDL
jgi:hypothetical protein